ncbi:tetratricopeptide repeat protein [Mycolicibacter minnesotensis]
MSTDPDATLAAAAFGDEPGRWPLPPATNPAQRWLRAVAAGGQGRYAGAATDLAALLREIPGGPLASLAHSTQGSFLRQLGGHDLARGFDGRALVLAGDDPQARADALVGLAADALGGGRYAASATLLGRAVAEGSTGPARLAVRRHWVTAELAMVTGDGNTAVRNAERAVELTPADMVRHRVKSQVVLAGALCCAGKIDRARTVADAALGDTERLGLVPLGWALASMLTDVGSATKTVEELRGMREDAAELIRRRGGTWRHR